PTPRARARSVTVSCCNSPGLGSGCGWRSRSPTIPPTELPPATRRCLDLPQVPAHYRDGESSHPANRLVLHSAYPLRRASLAPTATAWLSAPLRAQLL